MDPKQLSLSFLLKLALVGMILLTLLGTYAAERANHYRRAAIQYQYEAKAWQEMVIILINREATNRNTSVKTQ
jgi:hypothetical protein